MTTISSPSQDLLNQTNLTGYEPGAHRRRKRYQNSQQWLPPPKPLWRQSHSSRDDNYTSWSKQIESHLKASNAWQIITGRWKKPSEPSHLEAPLRPQDLITEHRERRQQEEDAQADGRRQTQDADRRRVRRTQTAGKMRRNKAERTAINDIKSRISDKNKEELGSLDDLKSIWDKLKVLYVESTCRTWVKELNTLIKLKGGRKTGEDPDEWMRKVITTGRSIVDNLGDLKMDTWSIPARPERHARRGTPARGTPGEARPREARPREPRPRAPRP